MFEIYNKYGFDHFEFEGYEVTIMKYSDTFCNVDCFNNIKVNLDFMRLDYNTQQWVLYHELGHIHHQHMARGNFKHKLYRIKRNIYTRLGLVVKEELEADSYAVKKLGKENALKGITKTIEMFNTKELKTRRLMIKLFSK